MTRPSTRLRSRLRLADGLALGWLGLRARRIRSALSIVGIAIAIAALVAVLGIATSSKASLLAELGAEGNLLTVPPDKPSAATRPRSLSPRNR